MELALALKSNQRVQQTNKRFAIFVASSHVPLLGEALEFKVGRWTRVVVPCDKVNKDFGARFAKICRTATKRVFAPRGFSANQVQRARVRELVPILAVFPLH